MLTGPTVRRGTGQLKNARERRKDLSAALESCTVIDMAVGAIMAQNRCRDETHPQQS